MAGDASLLESCLDSLFAGKQDSAATLAALDLLRERVGASADAASLCRARGLPSFLTRYLRDSELLDAASAVLAALASPDTRSTRHYRFDEHELVLRDASLCDGGLGWRVWRGALSLCEELASRPALVAERSVLELGAGCGLCGLLSARLGASRVVLSDSVPALLTSCAENASVNGLQDTVSVSRLDWADTRGAADQFEVVLGSDVIYAEEHAAALPDVLQRHLAPGGVALLVNGIRFPGVLDSFLRRLGPAGLVGVARVAWADADEGGDESVTLASPPLGMLSCLLWREGEGGRAGGRPDALAFAADWPDAGSLRLSDD